MTPSVILARLSMLYAMRAQLDAVIMMTEADAGIDKAPVEVGSCPNCGAPPEKVEDISTLDGTKKFHCANCQHYWSPVV